MTTNIIVTEITASGDGHYMYAKVGDQEYKIKHDDPCTWENRDEAFKELLELIPEVDRPAVEAEYDRYCEGIRSAEAEAERIANMTEEERLALFQASLKERNVFTADTTEYEEIHEKTEERPA